MGRWIGLSAGLSLILLSGSAAAFTLASENSAQLGFENHRVTFDYNWTSCPLSESVMNTAMAAAMELWNQVPTSGLILSQGVALSTDANGAQTSDADTNPMIVCDASFSTTFSSADPDFVSGVGGFDQLIGNYIPDAYVVLNGETSTNGSIDKYSSDEVSLAALLAHEMGHALGLGHSSNPASIMYFSIHSIQLRLSQDDQDGMTYLYPREELGGNGLFGCGSLALVGPSQKIRSKLPASRGLAEFLLFLACCLGGVMVFRRIGSNQLSS